MDKLLARADDLSLRRTEHLEKVKGSQVAKEREDLLEEVAMPRRVSSPSWPSRSQSYSGKCKYVTRM